MDIKNVFSQLKGFIHSGAGVEYSFGKPSKLGEVSIVPVSRVSFAFGGGAQSGPGKKQPKEAANTDSVTDKTEDFNGGGGGGIKTEPVGIFTIRGDKVRFHPVVSVKEIFTAFGLISFLIVRIIRLRRGKR